MRCEILGCDARYQEATWDIKEAMRAIKEAMGNIKGAMHCQFTHRSWLMNLNEDTSASARTLPRCSSPTPTVIARTAPCTDMKGGTQPITTAPTPCVGGVDACRVRACWGRRFAKGLRAAA